MAEPRRIMKVNKKTLYFPGMIFLLAALGLGIIYQAGVAVSLAVLIILVLVFYYRSELSFYGLIVYLPFQIALNLRPDIDLLSGRVLILLLALILLLQLFKNKENFNFKNQTTFGLVLFFVLAAASLLVASQQLWGLRKLLLFVSIFPLFFLTVYFAVNERVIKKIVWVITGGAAFSALIALAQFLAQFVFGADKVINFWAQRVAPIFYGQSFAALVTQNPSWLVEIGGKAWLRAVGLFPDPHMLAFYLGLTSPFVLAMMFYEKRHRLLLFTVYCLLFTVLLLTFSRGGYLGLAISLVFMVALAWHQLDKDTRLFFGSLAAIVLLIMLFLGAPIVGRLVSSFNLSEGSNFGRLQIWQESLAIVKEHPLLGVGLGNYPAAVNFNADYRTPITSHNLYLDIFAEIGIFGLLAWLWFWGGAALVALKKIKTGILTAPSLGALGALIYFAVHSFFETAIFNPTVLAFLMVAAGLSVAISNNNTGGDAL